MKSLPSVAPSTIGEFISTKSMNPADFVVSAASQLSGTLFAVVMFEKRILLGKLFVPSVRPRASSWSP